MGCYDYITATCPNCNMKIEDQIKIHCNFQNYDLNKPVSISEAEAIQGTEVQCNSCFKKFEVTADIPTYKVHVQLKERD